MTVQQIPSQQLTLPIGGMTCGGCAASVQQALSNLPGVKKVVVDLPAKQAQVTYDPAQVEQFQMVNAVAEAGYSVGLVTLDDAPSADGTPSADGVPSAAAATPAALQKGKFQLWARPVFFGLLGTAGLLILYLGLVSLAEGWTHAVELLLEDAWLVGSILGGFGVQVGLYTYLKTVIHVAARGMGALAGAGGGTSTAAMVACCAHHVADVLPLLGLSAAATFLAEYRIPFMLVGLATNLIGIGVIGYLIGCERRHLAECAVLNTRSAVSTST